MGRIEGKGIGGRKMIEEEYDEEKEVVLGRHNNVPTEVEVY